MTPVIQRVPWAVLRSELQAQLGAKSGAGSQPAEAQGAQPQLTTAAATHHSAATTFLPTPSAGVERGIRDFTHTAGTFDVTLSATAASGQVCISNCGTCTKKDLCGRCRVHKQAFDLHMRAWQLHSMSSALGCRLGVAGVVLVLRTTGEEAWHGGCDGGGQQQGPCSCACAAAGAGAGVQHSCVRRS